MSQSDTHASLGQQIQAQFQWRYATKLFDKSRKISAGDWEVLTDALRLAPSSYGLQPWQFVIVESAAVREQLAVAAPMNRAKFETASHVVVFARRKSITPEYVDSFLTLVSETRGVPLTALQDYRGIILNSVGKLPPEVQEAWTARQTYIALGALMTSAALLNIDTCALEGIDPARFDEILGLAGTDYGSVVALALGYRSPDDALQHAKKVRFAPAQVFKVV